MSATGGTQIGAAGPAQAGQRGRVKEIPAVSGGHGGQSHPGVGQNRAVRNVRCGRQCGGQPSGSDNWSLILFVSALLPQLHFQIRAPMHTHWHLPSRSRRTRRRMMGKALSGGTSAATRRVTRAWWYTGTLTTGVCTACPTRPPRVILTEATGSPDPLIELTNRLGRMTDWATLDAAEGINQLVPPGQEANHRGGRPVHPQYQAEAGGG